MIEQNGNKFDLIGEFGMEKGKEREREKQTKKKRISLKSNC